MATYSYPTTAELIEIAREKEPRLTADRPIFDILPTREVDAWAVIWEQQDAYGGLQAIRGINGQPGRVKPVGARRFMTEPGVYGEFMLIDEREMTMRRPWGTYANAGPIDITDLVMERQDQLLGRRLDRIEQVGWDLLVTGTYSVLRDSSILATDTFTFTTFTAGIPWATTATATPLANLRSIALLARGTGANFGAGATLYLNLVTFNNLLNNTNAADLGGRWSSQGGEGAIRNGERLNSIFMGEGLPRIEVYDEGYTNDVGASFVPFIPDAKGVLVGGRRNGQRIGEYRMVRNANNDNEAPGAYQKVFERKDQVPPIIEVHDGHSGAPVLYYPGSVVRVNL